MLKKIPFVAAAALAAASVIAHETWLSPNQGYVAPGMPVRLGLTSGGAFPIPESAIEPARLGKFGVRLAGETLTPTFLPGPRSLKFSLTPPRDKEGFATAFVSLKPRKLTLTEALVVEYLAEIGQADAFLAKWKARTPPRTWREEYTKHAKAFFRVGKATDESWKTPVGQNLEFIPLSDPTRASATTEFAVEVLRAGAPAAKFTLIALVDAKTPRAFAVTDESGRAAFKLDRTGRWLIEGIDLRESTKSGLDFESDFATMLVTVVPAPTAPASSPR